MLLPTKDNTTFEIEILVAKESNGRISRKAYSRGQF